MADKFLIAPINEGLTRNMKPWLIPDDAFEELNNAYIFRGRVKKRVGSTEATIAGLNSRLRIKLGTTDGSGNISGTVPGAIFKTGQMFSIGDETFTVTVTGAPGTMITTGAATTHTYNTTTGAYVIQGADALTDAYFYPAEPVMGFHNYEKAAINDENTYAFDTQFAYQLLATGWERLATGGAAAIWTGSNAEFFWSTTWRGVSDDSYILFTTNYNATDQLRYYDGTTWAAFNPQYGSNANETIESARIIIPFQNRLLFLNTIEKDAAAATATFVNRCRYSQLGSPLDANAFREDISGRGDFINAPTREAIVSVVNLKNRLIVYFERSTYELVYTRNEVSPFAWQEINSVLGCESTFSVIPFDKVVLGIGQTGIHACTGANVERIDNKIPDEIFNIHNDNDGVFRVHGIRDYYNEMAYWTMPQKESYNQVFPNRLLIYNYKNNTWAFFDDHITAFGYHQISSDLTWSEMIGTWEETWDTWDSGTLESKFKYVIAGNQQGYTFLMNSDASLNAPSHQITNISSAGGVVTITSIDHNLDTGDWVTIEDAEGVTELNDLNFKIKRLTDNTFSIDEAPAISGTYTGSGYFRLLSKVDVYTKRFNFYSSRGNSTNIEKTDFLVDKVDDGELTIDYLPSSSQISLRDDGIATGAILGTSILEMNAYTTLEDAQERFWHAIYLQAQGESVQLRFYYTDDQMKDTQIPKVGFEVHGILFHTTMTQEL